MSGAILSADEIIDASSPLYTSETQCWSEQKDLKPAVVLRPKSLPALQRVVRALYDSDLDFAVRCNGVGSSSAEDVILSMTAFNNVQFDPVAETVTIGAGQTFGDVERKMEVLAPGYASMTSSIYPFWSSRLLFQAKSIIWTASSQCSGPMGRRKRHDTDQRNILALPRVWAGVRSSEPSRRSGSPPRRPSRLGFFCAGASLGFTWWRRQLWR